MESSVPTILRPWVRIASTSKLLQLLYLVQIKSLIELECGKNEIKQKRGWYWPVFKTIVSDTLSGHIRSSSFDRKAPFDSRWNPQSGNQNWRFFVINSLCVDLEFCSRPLHCLHTVQAVWTDLAKVYHFAIFLKKLWTFRVYHKNGLSTTLQRWVWVPYHYTDAYQKLLVLLTYLVSYNRFIYH